MLTGDHGPVGLFPGTRSPVQAGFAGAAMMLSGFLSQTRGVGRVGRGALSQECDALARSTSASAAMP